MKKCDYIQKLFYPYLDRELEVRQNLEVEEHIIHCQQCSDLLNEEKRFLSVLANPKFREQGPPKLKDQIERMLEKKTGRLSRLFFGHPLKVAVAAAFMGAFSVLMALQFINHSSQGITPFVKASVESHLDYIQGKYPLEVIHNDHNGVGSWFKNKMNFVPGFPEVRDERITLVGGRKLDFGGDPMAQVSFLVQNVPVTLAVVKGKPEAFLDRNNLKFVDGRQFNIAHYKGLNTISWIDSGNHFTLVSHLPPGKMESCTVCHGKGSGLIDIAEVLKHESLKSTKQ